LNGICTNSPLAPVSDCPFGDDIVVDRQVIGNLQLPAIQMKCQEVLDYIASRNQSLVSYCNEGLFQRTCCQTCKSINNSFNFYLYRKKRVVMFSEIFLNQTKNTNLWNALMSILNVKTIGIFAIEDY
jgi:hypothetical protein